MKYIVFASSIYLNTLSKKGIDVFLEKVLEFHCMVVTDAEEDLPNALKKVERYGSFAFISENKYNKLKPHSDE
jgi:hypothetical protein